MSFKAERVQGLGRLLRKHQATAVDDSLGRSHRLAQLLEATELEKAQDERVSSPGWGALSWGLGAAASVAAFFCVFWLSEEKPLSYSKSDGVNGLVGASFETARSRTETLRFSDGTTVRLLESTRATVSETGPDGAHVNLLRGQASVSVVPAEDAEWNFRAGPFVVEVTGTKFDLDWNPNMGNFHIRMTEGSVLVSGPGINTPRTVVAGKELFLTTAKNRSDSESSQIGPSGGSNPSSTTAQRSKNAATGADAPSARTTRAFDRRQEMPAIEAGGRSPTVTWQALADKKRYSEALQLVMQAGLTQKLRQTPATELLRLADVARYAGDLHAAERTYKAIRERFPGTNSSAMAAFQLGRLAVSHPTAARWFEEYLRTQPGGPLAMEALGRLLEIHEANGNHDVASRTAKRYLASFPEGSHTPLAKRLSQP